MHSLGLLTFGLAYFILALSGVSFLFTGWALSTLLASIGIAIYALHRVIVRRAHKAGRVAAAMEFRQRITPEAPSGPE